MPNETATTSSEPSITSLVTGIINDSRELMHQELELARHEISDELTKTRQAAISFGVSLCLLTVGGLLLAHMGVHLIYWAADGGLPLWTCYLIVGGLLALAGALVYVLGRSRAESIHVMPPQTVETMKENVQWLKNRT